MVDRAPHTQWLLLQTAGWRERTNRRCAATCGQALILRGIVKYGNKAQGDARIRYGCAGQHKWLLIRVDACSRMLGHANHHPPLTLARKLLMESCGPSCCMAHAASAELKERAALQDGLPANQTSLLLVLGGKRDRSVIMPLNLVLHCSAKARREGEAKRDDRPQIV